MAPNVPMNKWLRHFGLAALLSVPSVALADAVELPSSQELNFIKITDSYQLKPNTRYALMAARNQWVSIQLVADAGNAAGGSNKLPVCVEKKTVSSSGKPSFDTNLVRVYREAAVEVPSTATSSQLSAPGYYFDILVPVGDWVFPAIQHRRNTVEARPTVEALPIDDIDLVNNLAVFWVDIFVPETAAGGIYEQTVVLDPFCDGPVDERANNITHDIAIEVTDTFTIPSTSSIASNIEWSIDNACRAHIPDRDSCWDAEKPGLSDL